MNGNSQEPTATPWLAGNAAMVTTRWTMVLSAGTDGPEGRAAFEAFCRTYWYPIYAFIRRQGRTPEDAQDLTQEFFTRLVERNWLAGVERGGTRFSTLLLTILKNFLINAHEHSSAQKRGGGQAPVSIDQVQAEEWFGAEPVERETPERTFERRWALALLDAATRRLRAEMETAGKILQFAELSRYLSEDPSPGDYAALAPTLGLQPNAIASAVYRLRLRLREMVLEELAGGRLVDETVEEEFGQLKAALRGT
jgi:RNA polymerase sigma-70 factor (ECF subfamily)